MLAPRHKTLKRVRCSTFVDWPIYPRLAHNMRASNGGRNAGRRGAPARPSARPRASWARPVARAKDAVAAGSGSRREPPPSAFLRHGATDARPRRLRVRYERAGRRPLFGRGRRQDKLRSDRRGAAPNAIVEAEVTHRLGSLSLRLA